MEAWWRWSRYGALTLLICGCEAPSSLAPPPRPAPSPAISVAAGERAAPAPAPPSPTKPPLPAEPAVEVPRFERYGGVDAAYPWARQAGYEGLAQRFAPPGKAQRVELAPESYGYWLRHLPLRPPGTPVRSYHGRTILAGDDRRLAAVVDLDLVGDDLQQCADTIMRLRAEYLRASDQADRIGFHFVSGFFSRWADYRRGTRIRLVDEGRRVEPYPGGRADDSREAFSGYLRDLFSYASTVSLAREAKPVTDEVAVGDFFILPGGPGHTVVVLDLARDRDGALFALLGQGFMPAQDMHVLRASPGSAWYRLTPGEHVDTPMWEPFPWDSLRRLE